MTQNDVAVQIKSGPRNRRFGNMILVPYTIVGKVNGSSNMPFFSSIYHKSYTTS